MEITINGSQGLRPQLSTSEFAIAMIQLENSRRATMLPRGPLRRNEKRHVGGTGGGLSHSSTYGCHQSAPLPRDWIVCSYARSRAMRMLRERKK